MKPLVIFVAALVFIGCGYYYVTSKFHHAEELYLEAKYCESLRVLQSLQKILKRAKYLEGVVLGAGLCGTQDLESAKKLFIQARGIESNSELGRIMLYLTIDLMNSRDSNDSQEKRIRINALLNESKKLGYLPSEKDIQALAEHDIQYSQEIK